MLSPLYSYDVAMDFLKNGFRAQYPQEDNLIKLNESASESSSEENSARKRYIPAQELEEEEEVRSSKSSLEVGEKKARGRAALVERAQMM